MYIFNQMFPGVTSQKTPQPICVKCDGRGVIPQDGKVVTCPACNGTGKEK